MAKEQPLVTWGKHILTLIITGCVVFMTSLAMDIKSKIDVICVKMENQQSNINKQETTDKQHWHRLQDHSTRLTRIETRLKGDSS